MKITELEGKRVRLGKTSITCVDESGKTRGVVRGLESLKSCKNPRTEWTIVSALKKAGIWVDCIDGLKDQVFTDGDRLYYINNIKPLLFFAECCEGKDEKIIESERARFNSLLDIAKKAETTMTVINCYIVN